MELSAIRDLTDDALSAQVLQAGESAFRIRFQKSMGNLEGLGRLKAYKVEIARIKTVRREREISATAKNLPEKGKRPAVSERNLRKKAREVQL